MFFFILTVHAYIYVRKNISENAIKEFDLPGTKRKTGHLLQLCGSAFDEAKLDLYHGEEDQLVEF